MRIISGKYKGRRLKTPENNNIRPTSDRLRENLFNIIMHSDLGIEDLLVMDIFSGTGAMGLEALSRGAEKCIFVEKSLASLRLLSSNIEHLAVGEQVQIMRMSATALGNAAPQYHKAVELVMMDAPFDETEDLTFATLERLNEGQWLADNAWIVAKIPAKLSYELPKGFVIIRELKAGTSKAIILQIKNEN